MAWSIHTAKINTVAWTPNSRHLATGSLDTNVIVWNPEKPMKRVNIKGENVDENSLRGKSASVVKTMAGHHFVDFETAAAI